MEKQQPTDKQGAVQLPPAGLIKQYPNKYQAPIKGEPEQNEVGSVQGLHERKTEETKVMAKPKVYNVEIPNGIGTWESKSVDSTGTCFIRSLFTVHCFLFS